jgi:hypothetical protein
MLVGVNTAAIGEDLASQVGRKRIVSVIGENEN